MQVVKTSENHGTNKFNHWQRGLLSRQKRAASETALQAPRVILDLSYAAQLAVQPARFHIYPLSVAP